MSRRTAITFCSTAFAAASMRVSSVAAVMDSSMSASMPRSLPGHRAAQLLRLLDQLPEPLHEIHLARFLGDCPRARGHGDELVEEAAELGRTAHQHQRRRLALDGLERLQRLRVLVAEVFELVTRHALHS